MIAGALAAWVPNEFWQAFFFVDHPLLAKIWGSSDRACSRNDVSFSSARSATIPLAAVLWNGGISFGGVITFIFADLIVLPILDIYRKYYGLKMAAFVTFYAAMAVAAFVVEIAFGWLGLIPQGRNALVVRAAITWNYTTWLNIIFLLLAAALTVRRFMRTGGPEMLRMMNAPQLSEEPTHRHRRY